MKKIGILGGMAPESTLEYYRILISLCRERGFSRKYPPIFIYSLNFEQFIEAMKAEDFSKVISMLSEGIKSLHKAGAEFALIASNTPHMFFDDVAAGSEIPLLSIVDETAKEARRRGFRKVGLWGSRFTMKFDFYEKGLKRRGLRVAVPERDDRAFIDEKIFDEFVEGRIKDDTREKMVKIARKMVKFESIEALILGCTEFTLFLNEKILNVPCLDTTTIHATAALDYSVAGK